MFEHQYSSWETDVWGCIKMKQSSGNFFVFCYLETHCSMFSSMGVARVGSLWMKVARTVMLRPIVSSSYCSRTRLHSLQRSTITFSPHRALDIGFLFPPVWVLARSSARLARRLKDDKRIFFYHIRAFMSLYHFFNYLITENKKQRTIKTKYVY